LTFPSHYNPDLVKGENIMNMKIRMIFLWSGVAILIVAGVVTLSLAFGGSEDTAVDDVNAIYTNAASTVVAQQQTLQVAMLSATANPTLNPATAVSGTLPTPTIQQQIPTLLPTSAIAGGGVTGCDIAVYVSDVTIPDGTTIAAGEYFTKTWKVSNTGSCTWAETYQLVFVSGDSLGGKATAIGKIVKPGESADVSVVLTSSSATGSITGKWRLSNDKGQAFGDALTVVINSGASVATVTPTSTGVVVATAIPFTATAAPVAATAVPTIVPATETPVTPVSGG
jgi:hypothetical protein